VRRDWDKPGPSHSEHSPLPLLNRAGNGLVSTACQRACRDASQQHWRQPDATTRFCSSNGNEAATQQITGFQRKQQRRARATASPQQQQRRSTQGDPSAAAAQTDSSNGSETGNSTRSHAQMDNRHQSSFCEALRRTGHAVPLLAAPDAREQSGTAYALVTDMRLSGSPAHCFVLTP
jgi:hypothetical protein